MHTPKDSNGQASQTSFPSRAIGRKRKASLNYWLCGVCQLLVLLVTDAELANPEFLRDVRNFAASLRISAAKWVDFLLDEFSRLDICVMNEHRQPVTLDAEIFEPTDAEIDADEAERVHARITDWFEATMCKSVPDHIRPRLRREARERFRFTATVLRALFPLEAMMWGVRPANDNERAANDNLPAAESSAQDDERAD
jgi:hypothetical protein